MDDKFSTLQINLGDPKTRSEVVGALRAIAEQIEADYYSGIAGWSDVSWSLQKSED